MADFVAVLRKTIGALGDNTPEMREKVYDKARATIEAKLAALDPQPPAAIIDRQRKALDDAIAVVRADYAAPVEPDDDFDDIIGSFDTPPPAAEEPKPAPAPIPAPTAAVAVPARDPVIDPVDEDDDADDRAGDAPEPESDFVARPELVGAPRPRPAPARKRSAISGAALAAALVAILVVAGGVYALWMNRDAFFGAPTPGPVASETETPDVATTAEELVEESEDDEAAAEEDVAELPAAGEAEPTAEQPAAPTPAPNAAVEKFTQRLMADGSEVDDGPAGGERTIGEGTSVATLVPPDEQAAGAGGDETAEPATPTQNDAAQPAVAVGQRAIFYEERTSSAQGSAEMGSIVWSVVRESPGGDMPAEPAIRAEATIPAKDIQLRMTIRRNGDQTLPAAHIVEMIFLTPDGFEGGAISNVSRMALKETEQAAGNPLAGIPAKIADGFFLIALSDSPNEIEANLTLLGSRDWLDIPIVYQTGRRALLSLEKGIPGERAFQEALEAWRQAPPTTTGSAG